MISPQEEYLKEEQSEEIKERLRHRDALLDIQAILATKSGRNFVKYLFESFDVGELPIIGLTGEFLADHLGFLRAGNSIFKIIAQANAEVAGSILAQVQKEKNAQIDYEAARRK